MHADNQLRAFRLGRYFGTTAEMWLAIKYGVPIVALGEHQHVPHGVPIATTIDEVETFLRKHITSHGS